MRREAIEYLGKPGLYRDLSEKEEIVDVLTAALPFESNVHTRVAIVRTIGQVGSPVAGKALIQAAGDKEETVRVAVCETLGQLKTPETARALDDLLVGDADLDVRLAAADALGTHRNRAAALALLVGLEDRDLAIQHRCRESLRRVLGTDYGNNLAKWREKIQTANFAGPARQTKSFLLF